MFAINEPVNPPDRSHAARLALKNIYGNNELGKNVSRVIELMQAYQHDPILVKLILIVRTLSSSISRNRRSTDANRIYNNNLAIFDGQNVYVELLWKYILSRLPSERDAMKFFNKLILDLLFLLSTQFMLDSYIYSLPNEIDKTEPLMQSMWPRSNV